MLLCQVGPEESSREALRPHIHIDKTTMKSAKIGRKVAATEKHDRSACDSAMHIPTVQYSLASGSAECCFRDSSRLYAVNRFVS